MFTKDGVKQNILVMSEDLNAADLLLSSGSLHEFLYRRRNHKQQYCLRPFGGFHKFDVSLSHIGAHETTFLQIIQSLQADFCNLRQVA